ncbi:hypothetical protein ATO7_16449 [Oceanococcus atlanticus]|uniref:Uncharacterized protein n=1 Tax=Oceanococcus atlanticus TaxID=1317117 RepID=A0A1Y1S9R9_9GAMM|nr:hypothetical protein [Oceanococcus atlanticus]ORE84964.1 hypothetical protein ATO7_16449 [Oceanococcus atlanticus]
MKLIPGIVDKFVAVNPPDFVALLQAEDRPSFDTFWKLQNQIKPIDFYCYLYARFGPPNGIQNLLRADHSDNLIHWEWSLRAEDRLYLIQGHNFRTEIWVSGAALESESLEVLIADIKQSFPQYGKSMGEIRKKLEHWIEFINPYQRIRAAVDCLDKELASLEVPSQEDQPKSVTDFDSTEEWSKVWNRHAQTISRATGLCFGIRSMLPVMAEAFVNLLMYMQMKPELKADDRLRENLFRQPIDVRVRGLSHNCVGFESAVDYSHEACRRYHSLVNERNDLLHGNVVVDKLKFNELYFNGRVPVFKTYSTMWERAFGVAQSSVGLDLLENERDVVDGFVDYVISCLKEKTQMDVRAFLQQRELGLSLDDGHLGVLFSGQLVDMVMGPKGGQVKGAPNKSLQLTFDSPLGLATPSPPVDSNAAELRR